MAVVEIDDRDARILERANTGTPGGECEGIVGVAQVVEFAQWRRDRSLSSASTAIACSGTARLLSRVLVCLTCPFAYARRIWTTAAARSTSPCSSANNSEGRRPVASGQRARGEGLTRSLTRGRSGLCSSRWEAS